MPGPRIPMLTETGRWLDVHEITPDEADDLGCPGSTHVLRGTAGGGWQHVGTLTVTTGRAVRMTGWTILAKRVRFAAADGSTPVRGSVAA